MATLEKFLYKTVQHALNDKDVLQHKYFLKMLLLQNFKTRQSLSLLGTFTFMSDGILNILLFGQRNDSEAGHFLTENTNNLLTIAKEKVKKLNKNQITQALRTIRKVQVDRKIIK